MDVRELLKTSRLYNALHKSEIYKGRVRKVDFKSGRFKDLPRFVKLQNYILESLYTINDLHNPSAFRIYLYLLRQITGWESRYRIEFRPKKMKIDMNMGNNFYKGIKILEQKNMIKFENEDGIRYLCLNPEPDTWITKSIGAIDKIMDKEINVLLGKEDSAFISKSSSSWSSSSSSSASYPSNGEDLLMELDRL